MSAWWSRLKENVGLSNPEEEQPSSNTLLQHLDEASTLSRTQRVYGFATCFGLAVAFGLLSSLFFLSPTRFAILYTLSNLSAIASTMFLMGPLKQLTRMFDKGRIVATCIYLISMALTLWAALHIRSLILTLLFLCIQLAALLWLNLKPWKSFSFCFLLSAWMLALGTVSRVIAGRIVGLALLHHDFRRSRSLHEICSRHLKITVLLTMPSIAIFILPPADMSCIVSPVLVTCLLTLSSSVDSQMDIAPLFAPLFNTLLMHCNV